MKECKRGLALLLTAVMLFSLFPPSAFAGQWVPTGGMPVAYEAVAGPTEEPDSAITTENPAVEVPDGAIAAETPAVEVPDGAITTENPAVEEPDSVAPAGGASLKSEIDGPGGANPNPNQNSVRPRGDEDAAYEISYNLSGSGYWITVGSDESRAATDDQYVLFDENGNYDIQLRESDDFQGGYRVEVRYRMRAGQNWSVPETVTFPAPNVGRTVAGHTLRAQSKWLTQIRYAFNHSDWHVVNAEDYDEDGNYAMTFPDDRTFPLTVRFEYQTKSHTGVDYSGDWTRERITTPDEEDPHDPVYQDMNDACTILGRTFYLNQEAVGLVQYRYFYDGAWVEGSVGTASGDSVPERQFDTHGNYTLDMGDRKDFPIDVYFRALETDGWKYLSGTDSQSSSVKRYANVFDTATIDGHVFAIHTTWMNDVRYAFLPESALNAAKDDYTITDGALDWATVSNSPGAYRRFQQDGSYTVDVSPDMSYPAYMLFKPIGPTGDWDTVAQWTTAEERMSHLRTFANIDSTADYEGHTFHLRNANLGDIAVTVRNSDRIVTHEWTMVQDRSRLQENDGDNNNQVFDAGNTYTIQLTQRTPDGYADTFPLTVTFRVLGPNGWSDDIIWSIPFRGWEQSQKVIKIRDTDETGYTFRLSADFMGDTRYRWDGDYNWTYVVPDPDSAARRYGSATQRYPYDESGNYVIPVRNPEASGLFTADGNSYRLNSLTLQYWDAERGWTSPQGTFTSLTDVRRVTTANDQRHEFRLSSIYSDEVRYTFTNPDTTSNPDWVLVGHNEQIRDEQPFDNDGNYRIEFEEDADEIPFPTPVYFEAYTDHGWDKPQVTLVGTRNTAQAGQGTFQKAGDILRVANGSTSHDFMAYYPWANSVRYTLTDRVTPDNNPPTVTIGPDEEFARQHENYRYFPSGVTIPIELDEGDFFPFTVRFEARDNQGNSTTVAIKDSAGNTLRDENNNLIREVDFIQNQTYQVGSYQFVAKSHWMDTIRIYLPERTVSVGHGIGADGAPLSDQWLRDHSNYQKFETDNSYTIPVRRTDVFPLEVEFLERSVDNHTRPVRHTFRDVTDTWNSAGTFSESHTFRLQYDHAAPEHDNDTVRYILAYHENLTDQSGVLRQGQEDSHDIELVSHAAPVDNDEHSHTFDEDGNFRIILPNEGPYSALPVDVWFAIPDENGEYGIDTVYQKATFNSKDDRVTVSYDKDRKITFLDSTQSGGALAPAPKHTFSVYAEWMDEVHYKLPRVPDKEELPEPQEITVGPDSARAAREAASARDERREPLYVTYDGNGEYVIELEEDAFFPYVVNVRYRLPSREAFVPEFDEDGHPVSIFDNNGQILETYAEVRHFIQGNDVYELNEDGQRVPVLDPNGQRVPAFDANGNFASTYFEEEPYIVKDNFVWKWASGTQARVPALAVNRNSNAIEIVHAGGRVRWLNAFSEEPTLPDIDADGNFRRTADNKVAYTQPKTRSAEESGQFEFRTPNDRVVWNGHTFGVHSTRVNPSAAVRAVLVLGNSANERSVIPFRLAGMPATPDARHTVGVRVANPAPSPHPAPISPANNPGTTSGDSTNPGTNNGNGTNPGTTSGGSTTSGDAQAQLLSTQPLTEVQLEANLEGYFNLELDNAHVELYMPDMERDGEQLAGRFVWGEWNMGNYNYDRKDWNINPWNRYRESVNYRVLTPEGQRQNPLKLSQYSTTSNRGRTQYFEIVSGSTEQLNASNIRYVIRTRMKTPSYDNLLKMKVAYMDTRRGGVRINGDRFEYFDESSGHPFSDQPAGMSTNGIDAYTAEHVTTVSGGQVTETQRVGVYRFTVDETWRDGRLWMTLKRNQNADSYSMFKDLNADIYEGFWFDAKEAQAGGRKIDKPLWETELDTQRVNDRYASYTNFVNGPQGVQDGPRFTIVWKNGDDPIGIMPFRVIVDVDTTNQQQNPEQGEEAAVVPVTFSAPRTHNDFIPGDPPTTELERSKEVIDDSGLLIAYYYTQTEGNLFDNRYYVRATYNVRGHTWAEDEISVYAGTVRYNSRNEAEAAAQNGQTSRAMDVTRQIFNAPGFGADYSENGEYGNGVVFSVFDKDGALIASKKIVTERREFLTFGRMTSPMGGLYDTDRSDPDYRRGLKSEMERQGRVYSQEVLYSLPDSEYRGIYGGRALYNLSVGYMRDLVPSAPGDYGVKIVAASARFDTYDAAMKSQSLPVELTPRTTGTTASGDTAAPKPTTFNYTAAYRNGVYFHLFNADGTLIDCRYVYAVEPEKSTDTYFEAYGARKRQEDPSSAYLSYAMPGNMDTYFSNGYQTVLILNTDGSPVTDETIYPVFDISEDDGLGNQVRIYAGKDKIAGDLQTSGKTGQSFSASVQSPISYSAAATNQKHLKNYWVTYLTQHTGGPKLFVNTANDTSGTGENVIGKRHVFLQQQADSYQDIFIANIGDEPLNNVTLTLASGDSSLLVVDDYWALNGEPGNRTLAAFTKETIQRAEDGVAPGHGRYENYLQADIQPANVAKIRVRPKNPTDAATLSRINENLIISGTDAHGNRQQSIINLDGSIGQFKIKTEALSGKASTAPGRELTRSGEWVDVDRNLYDDYSKDAVQYTAFSRVIQTDWDLNDNGVHFEITRGRLPDGFPAGYRRDVYQQQFESGQLTEEDFYKLQQIRPNGELFGVPLESGDFTFTVTATFSYTLEGASDPLFTSQDSKEYTLHVLPNETDNVEGTISREYEVKKWIPDLNITDAATVSGDPLSIDGADGKHRGNSPVMTLDRDVRFEFQSIVSGVGDYDWVLEVYLNGIPLVENVDYTRHRGSEADDINRKSIEENCNSGLNTIAVVARQDGNQWNPVVKQADANFTVHGSRKGTGSNHNNDQTNPVTPTPSPVNPSPGPVNPGPNPPGPAPTPRYSVTVNKPSHGTLSASAKTVRAGTTVTLTATPGEDYVLDEVTVKGKSSKKTIATSPTRNDNQRTFTMPSEGVNVSATFARVYAVELAKVDFGFVTVNSERNIEGRSVTITAHPEQGYKAEDIRVYANNERLPLTSQGDNTATFRMPASNVYVSATFSRVYDVTLANEDGLAFGYVTVSSEHNTAGTSVTITAHPEAGYRAEDIRALVNNNERLPVTSVDENTSTFVMPASNVYVSATFVPLNPYRDISESDWFYADANWAIERGLMTGVRADTWAPYDNISTATAVVTLARLQMGDQLDNILKEYENDMFDRPWLPRGPAEGESTTTTNWYYREARWAAASGILTENVFTGRDPLSRANFAIILRNYLRHRGIVVEVPEPFEFSDADAIRARGEELHEDLNEAFQILRTADVFRGDRTESMLPNNNSTRAHMAALLHRLTNYIGEYERRWTQNAEENGG